MSKLFKKAKPVLKWIGWVLLVQLILINVSAAIYAYKITHYYRDKDMRPPASTRNIFVKTWRLFTGPRLQRNADADYPSFPFDTLSFHTAKGLRIDAWYSAAEMPKGTVILFHGVTANKSYLLPEAGEFRYLGYNVLLVDFRGHGNSDGNNTTIGAFETEEVKLAYDFIKSKNEWNIFLYGVSMGASTVIKAVSQYGLKPGGVLLEMPFYSLETHMEARARLFGFRGFPEKPFGFFVTGWISIERGFNAYGFKTTTYARDVHCPVLMQYGEMDHVVLPWESARIFAALSSPQKKLVAYAHAAHESLSQNDTPRWREEIQRFLQANTH